MYVLPALGKHCNPRVEEPEHRVIAVHLLRADEKARRFRAARAANIISIGARVRRSVSRQSCEQIMPQTLRARNACCNTRGETSDLLDEARVVADGADTPRVLLRKQRSSNADIGRDERKIRRRGLDERSPVPLVR